MPEEDILSSDVRNAILGKVAGLGKKPVPVLETRTPGVVTTPTQVVETVIAETKTICGRCGHKIWNDGTEWVHSGMKHDENCECIGVIAPTGAKANESVRVVKASKAPGSKFDSTTPFDQLLEACAVSHTAVEEEENLASDEARAMVLKKIGGGDMGVIKNWKF